MEWQSVINRGINGNTIREIYLYKVPLLKTCDNWGAVKEIGRIDFKGKNSNYHGALVLYAEKYYFVPDTKIEALAPYRKWNLKNTIKVVVDDKKNNKKINKMDS